MSGRVEAFLDATPGETRGVILRDGRFERLFIQRDDDFAGDRLGARSVGRVTLVDPVLRGAFVDLGGPGPAGFLPFKGRPPRVGEKLDVQVAAEPRESKGPTLRRLGAGEGEARLTAAGPDVAALLAQAAPDVTPRTGLDAARAALDAEEAALTRVERLTDLGLDIAVERTRALIAVDIDHAGGRGRDQANRLGLAHAARLIRLKSWGGLVAVDLAGTALDGDAMSRAAKEAFSGDGAAVGPLSRFGLLQLSLPWRHTPVEERLAAAGARVIDAVRRLNIRLQEDRGVARVSLYVAPADLARAAPLVARLGPRAAVAVDSALMPGAHRIEEG